MRATRSSLIRPGTQPPGRLLPPGLGQGPESAMTDAQQPRTATWQRVGVALWIVCLVLLWSGALQGP
jgi:hypothetical protein